MTDREWVGLMGAIVATAEQFVETSLTNARHGVDILLATQVEAVVAEGGFAPQQGRVVATDYGAVHFNAMWLAERTDVADVGPLAVV